MRNATALCGYLLGVTGISDITEVGTLIICRPGCVEHWLQYGWSL
jgi:hypothetical protein